ncbi:MAG: 4-hydroxy-tetrahydrodipicolinate synthase [Deltaproteobacteria bacterium RBG_13_49_15]|nr:MAG: 4-hydroxy-tetrahydrodipicolinate synthase [Deltaproteobacteria bacterium RBG_13_49_15]
MIKGCFTALVTPYSKGNVDGDGLRELCDFQIENGISGILAVGTTGESPTLSWDEHNHVIETIAEITKKKCLCIAGTGSNNTTETLSASEHAVHSGAKALLLVDPYYNGPSSLEIRKEYVAPVAKTFPGVDVIPYVIPGRTGAQLFPEDLALLYKEFQNVKTVKEATADLENMKRTRTCCGPDFTILSGDDGMTYEMMVNPHIKAAGVISVASNVAPGALVDMVRLLREGKQDEAGVLAKKLEPLFKLVTVKTKEKTYWGEVVCRARNPLAIKTLMSILGMPSGGCRRPLGKMTKNGLNIVLEAARRVQSNHPEIFAPIERFFGVDINSRLNTPSCWEDLAYGGY